MRRFAVIQCPHPECCYPDNRIGLSVCDRCQNPLTYRYLWAMGKAATRVAAGSLMAKRYLVVGPQIWLDTTPSLPPQATELLGLEPHLPYLRLHPHRLHLPGIFDICPIEAAQLPEEASQVLLLDNGPITPTGQLQPSLEAVWSNAPAVRQLNWLWQILQLWQPLKAEGVTSSLLIPENLHVEGWRVRLRELVADRATPDEWSEAVGAEADVSGVSGDRDRAGSEGIGAGLVASWARTGHLPQSTVLSPAAAVLTKPLTTALFSGGDAPTLHDLAEVWQTWAVSAQSTIRPRLQELCQKMRSTPDTATGMQSIAEQLNYLLLEQAAALPLHIDLAAATTVGTQRSHNEDACYPSTQTAQALNLPRLGIVCDGIGGHEGGEVASQLAIRSLQLQLHIWLAELAGQAEPLSPQVMADQLAGVVRVVNNLIAGQNDSQKREQRQRMGTTLVMAVQPPQTLSTEQGRGNTHELYLVHVGDSRAYWISSDSCQQLTVDDDVANREVRAGRTLYSQVTDRPDAAALTQALGTREADWLRVTVQRFILDQDGILLLCSDGLSDNRLIEQHWASVMQPVLQGKLGLETATQTWIDLANRHNGHDNASLVLMHCQLNPQALTQLPHDLAKTSSAAANSEANLTESAAPLFGAVDRELEAANQTDRKPRRATVLPKRKALSQSTLDGWVIAIGVTALTFVLGALAVAIWREVAPTGFHPQPSSDSPAQVEGQD
jgi:protein phosphatase